MMVYVSGINERFNSDIDKTNNKIQYIYQSTYTNKDSVHTTSSSTKTSLKNQFSPHVKL